MKRLGIVRELHRNSPISVPVPISVQKIPVLPYQRPKSTTAPTNPPQKDESPNSQSNRSQILKLEPLDIRASSPLRNR